MTYQELRGSLDALIEVERKLAQRRYEEALATYRSSSFLAGGIFVLAIGGALLPSREIELPGEGTGMTGAGRQPRQP
jgi:hypothetical protein